MKTEIVKVEVPKEITQEQVNVVKEAFRPNFDAMGELEPRYKALTDMKLAEPTEEQVKEARLVRLALVKTRTGTRDIHKELKADALVYGRYLDGMKKAQSTICEKWESDLAEIEKHFENIERERITNLQAEREKLLSCIGLEVIPNGLGIMDDGVWDAYYDGVYQDIRRKKEESRIAEEERIAKEKAEAEAKEQMRLENEKLKAEAEKAEAEKKALEKVKAEQEAKEAEERRIIEEANRKEKEAIEAKLNEERKERERLEAEKAEKEAKEKAEKEVEAKRVANMEHRNGVQNTISNHLANIIGKDAAEKVLLELIEEAVPYVTITY